MKKIIALVLFATTLVSCQFSETMTINEDGSGRMAIQMDLGEMMAFSGEFSPDSTMVKQDTIISFKDMFEEKKDSIAKLPAKEQERLKKMENYKVHMDIDPESKKMLMEVFVDFKNVEEANDLFKGLDQVEGVMPGSSSSDASDDDPMEVKEDILGVRFSYNDGVFKRDAYIIDETEHQKQIDSMKQAAAFMSEMKYKVKYTFPKKIKKSSAEDAMFSLDGKTVTLERSFFEYFKNPDVLDLEIELEK